jgi:hypothetical protein
VGANRRAGLSEGLLIDPHASIGEAHKMLERIDAALSPSRSVADTVHTIFGDLADLRAKLRLPSSVQ